MVSTLTAARSLHTLKPDRLMGNRRPRSRLQSHSTSCATSVRRATSIWATMGGTLSESTPSLTPSSQAQRGHSSTPIAALASTTMWHVPRIQTRTRDACIHCTIRQRLLSGGGSRRHANRSMRQAVVQMSALHDTCSYRSRVASQGTYRSESEDKVCKGAA